LAIVAVAAATSVYLAVALPGNGETRVMLTLLALSLLCASVLYLAIPGAPTPPDRLIPIRFGGDPGRFTLRRHGRRRVDIHAGGVVVARLVASDYGDELVIDPRVSRVCDIADFGAALGRAIEQVAAADSSSGVRVER
jgi:hypothetical protein